MHAHLAKLLVVAFPAFLLPVIILLYSNEKNAVGKLALLLSLAPERWRGRLHATFQSSLLAYK